MRNIQAQYQDLLEGKLSKANFMRNVRMQFPQHISPVSSYDDTVKILKGKRILSEAKQPEGVYKHNPNAEADKARGIDHLNYYQVQRAIHYELSKMPEITDENYVKARKKVVSKMLKNPDAYRDLQIANYKAVEDRDEDLKMKEVKKGNHVDKPNGMKVVKKDEKGNTQDGLGKTEKRKSKNGKGVEHMTQTPKGKLETFPTPGKEKIIKEGLKGRFHSSDNTYTYDHLVNTDSPVSLNDLHTVVLAIKNDKDELEREGKKTKVVRDGTVPYLELIDIAERSQVQAPKESVTEAKDEAWHTAFKANLDTALEKKPELKAKALKAYELLGKEGIEDFYGLFVPPFGIGAFLSDVDAIIDHHSKNESKVRALKEHILGEMTAMNPHHEEINVGSRVKKKDAKEYDATKVGNVTEFDGDTATVKWDDGSVEHMQKNVLTKKEIPALPKEENPLAKMPNLGDKGQSWAGGQVKRESKLRKLKEKLLKTVKETMYTRTDGANSSTVVASSNTAKSALRQQGYREIPNTGDVKAI